MDALATGASRSGQYARRVTPEQLQDVVRTAVAGVVGRGELPVDVPAEVVIDRPKNPEHGDYATNVALRLAKPAGRPPREVAELVAAELRAQAGIASVDVAGPGFLNITLAQVILGQFAVQAVAQQVVADVPRLLELPEDEQVAVFAERGVDAMVADIRDTLDGFGVHFDRFFSEKTLHESGALEKAVTTLRGQGHVFETDGAVWLRTTDFGDDKDRVLVKADGEPTYFAADCAYYLDKRARGFDRVVILLGADHSGYVGRYKALVAAAGDDPTQHLEIQIGQLVNLVRNGEQVRMSKRKGNFVLLTDLVDAVGSDAARYALARASVDQQIDIDADLWSRQSNDNPVFYVQYAHARISSVLRNAADLGLPLGEAGGVDVTQLAHERETDLLRAIGEFPRVLSGAAELRAPHRVARYLEELAGTYHRFYDSCRVLPRGDEEATSRTTARLWLCAATATVLRNGLAVLGVSAPERM